MTLGAGMSVLTIHCPFVSGAAGAMGLPGRRGHDIRKSWVGGTEQDLYPVAWVRITARVI